MLDANIADIVRRKVALDMAAQEVSLQKRINEIKSEAAAHGMLASSRTVLLVDAACAEAMHERGAFIWTHLQRCIATAGAKFELGLEQEIKAMIATYLPEDLGGLAGRADEMAKQLGMMNEKMYATDAVKDARLATIEHLHTEVDLFLMALKKTPIDPGYTQQNVFNIHGSTVGALQTGANSSAQVNQTMTQQSLGNLAEALTALKSELLTIDRLPNHNKDEVIELIDDGTTELGKSKPNMTKIGSYLKTIGSTVQGAVGLAANLKPALDSVNAAWSMLNP